MPANNIGLLSQAYEYIHVLLIIHHKIHIASMEYSRLKKVQGRRAQGLERRTCKQRIVFQA